MTVGVVDLFVTAWFDVWVAPYALVRIAGWWVLRAATQRHVGGRRADWLIAGGFVLLGLFHLVAARLRLATTSSPGL